MADARPLAGAPVVGQRLREEGRYFGQFSRACSCRVFLKVWPDGLRVASVSMVPMSDKFMAMRWRAWKPRTHWRPRDTGFRAFGGAGTPVGARKTSVGIQSGIQG